MWSGHGQVRKSEWNLLFFPHLPFQVSRPSLPIRLVRCPSTYSIFSFSLEFSSALVSITTLLAEERSASSFQDVQWLHTALISLSAISFIKMAVDKVKDGQPAIAQDEQTVLQQTLQPDNSVKSFDELTSGEKTMCDDLIDALADCNLGTFSPDDTTRERFWRHVFHNWTTNHSFEHPGVITEMSVEQAGVKVGFLKARIPPSPLRRPDGSVVYKPAVLADCPIWIVPKIQMGPDGPFDIIMMAVDKYFLGVPLSRVQFDKDIQLQKAYVEAVIQYDVHEQGRIAR